MADHLLRKVPISAMSSETKCLISTLLNPPKFSTTSEDLFRDWRGFAQLCGLNASTVSRIGLDSDPFACILNIIQKRSKNLELISLTVVFDKLERLDIVKDCEPYFKKDAELYLERLERSENAAENNDYDIEADILTFDDQFRIEQGKNTQHYDAFLLYAEEDIGFANEVVEQLEKANNMKLCLKERDLIAGISFEHEAIMKLILERCNRLLIILSPDFLKSPANKFFVNFAQAAGIDKNQERKIIPCVYKNCELPPQLTFLSKIYHNKLSPEFFWKKLVCSIKVTDSTKINANSKEIKKSKSSDNKTDSRVQNGFTIKAEEKVTSDEAAKCTTPKKNRLFSFKKKDTTELKNSFKTDKETEKSESIPDLPSLSGLDSLSSLVSEDEKRKKPEKFMKNCKKKLRSLLERAQ